MAATAVVLVLLLAIGPVFRRLTRLQRTVLVLLRLAVVALIVLAMLRPTHVSTTRRPQTAVLIVLFDQSRSMQLPQAAAGATRWSAQRETLQEAQPLLQALSKSLEVKVYGYEAEVHPVELAGPSLPLPASPEGQQTDIGTSLHAVLQRELGKRLAGVVLLGDGVQTAFRPSVEIPEAGRELARLGYPLYAVPFGLPTDAVQARDVAVENLQDQYTVFVKNELPVTATIAIRGCTNQPIPVKLLVEKPGGEVETVGPVNVVAREEQDQVAVELRYVPEQPGNYKLSVQAAEQPGELVTKNNQLSAFLRVLEGGLKILYLEGELREEQLFLRRILEASPDMELEFLWVDSRRREAWPIDVASRLRDARYDAFILGDLDAAALGKDQLQSLAEAVSRGKGLALLGGYHSYGAGGYRDTPLADVMPITMDRLERQDFRCADPPGFAVARSAAHAARPRSSARQSGFGRGQRGRLAPVASVGRCEQVSGRQGRRRRAGRRGKRRRSAAVGRRRVRPRPGRGDGRRLDVPLGHAGLRRGPSAVLAAGHPVAGRPRRPGAGPGVGQAGATAISARRPRDVYRRRELAQRRADRRGGVALRIDLAGRQPPRGADDSRRHAMAGQRRDRDGAGRLRLGGDGDQGWKSGRKGTRRVSGLRSRRGIEHARGRSRPAGAVGRHDQAVRRPRGGAGTGAGAVGGHPRSAAGDGYRGANQVAAGRYRPRRVVAAAAAGRNLDGRMVFEEEMGVGLTPGGMHCADLRVLLPRLPYGLQLLCPPREHDGAPQLSALWQAQAAAGDLAICGRSRCAGASGGSAGGEDDLPPGMDESKLEQVMEELGREADSLDEDDPRQAAQLMRKLHERTGMPLSGKMEEAMRRMEAGEDPDQIEQEMGDFLDEEDPLLGAEPGGRLRGLAKRLRAPAVDETLYDLE